jgi:hypothetical protein
MTTALCMVLIFATVILKRKYKAASYGLWALSRELMKNEKWKMKNGAMKWWSFICIKK